MFCVCFVLLMCVCGCACVFCCRLTVGVYSFELFVLWLYLFVL